MRWERQGMVSSPFVGTTPKKIVEEVGYEPTILQPQWLAHLLNAYSSVVGKAGVTPTHVRTCYTSLVLLPCFVVTPARFELSILPIKSR